MFARIRKAVIAGIGAGVTAYGTAMLDGHVTTGEWETLVGSVVVVGVITWLVPNRAQAAPPAGTTGPYVKS